MTRFVPKTRAAEHAARFLFVGVLLFIAIPALCQSSQPPTVYEVFNGWNKGSNATVLAQGSIISIYGYSLGSSTNTLQASLPLTTALPNDATGTAVQIIAGGVTYNAWILSSASSQVLAIVPSNVPAGAATLQVTVGTRASSTMPITIVRSNFGTYTKNAFGSGPASALNYVSGSNMLGNALTASAQPGQVLTLYGTGLGATLDGKDNVAPKVGNIGSAVTVNVGGINVTPLYAGRSPQYPGLDQINFQLPSQVQLGCYVPVIVLQGGSYSNTASVSISKTNLCTHPLGLGAAALSALDAPGGVVRIGAFQVGRQSSAPLQQGDSASGQFMQADAAAVFSTTMQYVGMPVTPPIGSCLSNGLAVPVLGTSYGYVLSAAAVFTSFQTIYNPLFLSPYSDAGPSLSLALSGAATNPQTTLSQTGFNYGLLKFGEICSGIGCSGPTYLTTGSWTLSAPGGADVGAFNANFTLPPMPQWTNASAFDGRRVSRANNLTVNWTGGGSSDVMLIAGYAQVFDRANAANNVAQSFVCSAAASAGTFAVPSAILRTLPASPLPSASVSYKGFLSISTTSITNFTAPLATGGNLDGGAIVWNYSATRGVAWQ